jgi:flagellar basal-body rod protein FlgC
MAFEQLFSVAGSGMSAQLVRLNTTASNLSNAETVSGSPSTAFRSRHPIFAQGQASFADAFDSVLNQAAVGVRVESIAQGKVPVRGEYRPAHPLADDNGMVYLSNVNVIQEMADMVSSSRSYEANIAVLNTGKQLFLDTLQMGQ